MRANPTWPKLVLFLVAGGLIASACGKDETISADSTGVSPDSGSGDDGDDSSDDDGADDSSDDDTTDDSATDDSSGGMGGAPSSRPGSTTDPGGDTGPVPGSSGIGRPCSFNDDCSEGLYCMTSDSEEWFGGGPAHGYCTLDCLADAAICLEADPGALCLQTADDQANCMLGCSLGAVDKCHGRGDVACDAASIGVGFCRPVCRSDDDCDDGFCDLGVGHCVATEPEGDPIGSPCDPEDEIEDSNCASQVCLPLTETFAVCSGFCNLSEVGCGSDNQIPDDPSEPICTFGAADGAAQNDLGFCNQRCNCDGDCLHPDALCLILPEDLQPVFGTDGICVDPDFPDDDPDFTLGNACPDQGRGDSGASAVDSGMSGDESPSAEAGPMGGGDEPEAGPEPMQPEPEAAAPPATMPEASTGSAEGGM